MSHASLQSTIEAAWENRDGINAQTKGEMREAIETAHELLDSDKTRVAEKTAARTSLRVRALKRVDLPALGSPTMPMESATNDNPRVCLPDWFGKGAVRRARSGKAEEGGAPGLCGDRRERRRSGCDGPRTGPDKETCPGLGGRMGP